jgi:hypothetical protein
MNMPPLFMGLTLLFWGWEVKLLPLAVVGAVILELPRLIRWRWDFTDTEMNRLWDLCEILFLGAAVYAYATTDIAVGPAKFIPWLPIIFFPFAAGVAYSAHDRVRFSTYLWLWRKKGRAFAPTRELGWFVPYWYFLACFIAASMANERDRRFYAGVVLLGAWLLWIARSRSAPAWVRATVLSVVAAAGFLGHVGLTRLQALVENKASQIFEDLNSPDVELTQTRTAIGSVGKLEMSGRIVMRIETDGQQPPPELLRKASFNIYQSSGNAATWIATAADFGSVSPSAELGTWPLTTNQNPLSTVTIEMFLLRGTGILPVPNGPTSLDNLLAAAVQTNRCGSVRVREAPPLVRCTVKYGSTSSLDAPPSASDLDVPVAESPAMSQIATELGLASQPTEEVMRRIADFFREKFSYSRYLKGTDFDPTGRNTALSQFLLRDRAGHCEYFATAATLLLRQAGVPARYATGYAVPEEAGSGRVHLVRARHAHAWALAYVGGTWKVFDTTPGGWNEIEEAQKSSFQPLSDLLSWLKYRFVRWRYYGDRAAIAKRLVWIAPVAVLWFLWRLFAKKRQVRLQKEGRREERPPHGGLDSEFYLIEKHLAKSGVPRRAEESLGKWMRRLETARHLDLDATSLREIIALHYAYRFDPRAITAEKRNELKSRAESWLNAWR